jgi:hypothetical protein
MVHLVFSSAHPAPFFSMVMLHILPWSIHGLLPFTPLSPHSCFRTNVEIFPPPNHVVLLLFEDTSNITDNPSLQRFKLNIASSVVTQQNAGLGSMNTGEVLDLFKVSSEEEEAAQRRAKAKNGANGLGGGSGHLSTSKVLEG